MSAPEVYWGSGSPYAWRVLLGFAIKNVPYESHLLSFSEREHRSPEYRAISPRGKVPALRAGEFTLTESIAILAWLDRTYRGPSLFGETPEQTGRVWEWVFSFTHYLEPPLQDQVVRPLFFNRQQERAAEIAQGIVLVHAELARWEQGLAGRRWFVGDGPTAADIVLFVGVQSLLRAARKPAAQDFELDVLPLDETYPRLAAWTEQIEALPGYEATYPPHWRQG